MHHKSWSGLRRLLEEDRLCPALRGRVQYFMTRYHDAHDEHGRFCVRVDGQEYVQASIFHGGDDLSAYYSREARMQAGSFTVWEVGNALDAYMDELTIEEALVSPDALVRMFAVLDRRVGKRRLPELAADLPQQPPWLRFFYSLRLEAEGIQAR